MGRPLGPPETRRPCRVVTFLTGEEFADLERIAEREERSLSAVVHRILSRDLGRKS